MTTASWETSTSQAGALEPGNSLVSLELLRIDESLFCGRPSQTELFSELLLATLLGLGGGRLLELGRGDRSPHFLPETLLTRFRTREEMPGELDRTRRGCLKNDCLEVAETEETDCRSDLLDWEERCSASLVEEPLLLLRPLDVLGIKLIT